MKEKMSNVAESVLGKTTRQEKKPWYDENAEERWKEEMKRESKRLIIVRELIQRSINELEGRQEVSAKGRNETKKSHN
jgi:hypothetical protein